MKRCRLTHDGILCSMSAKITRRQIGLLMAAASAAQSQTTAPQQPPGTEADVEAIRQRRRDAAAQLAKVKLPPGSDPAFVFHA
jgi:hypothetical protein